MNKSLFKLNIVSVEKEIFSGKVCKLCVTGSSGEFEVLPNHSPLLTALLPGQLTYTEDNGTTHSIIVFGGMIEVQPLVTTVLADSYIRKEDINEEEILKIKDSLENKLIKGLHIHEYAHVRAELIKAAVQLKFFRKHILK